MRVNGMNGFYQVAYNRCESDGLTQNEIHKKYKTIIEKSDKEMIRYFMNGKIFKLYNRVGCLNYVAYFDKNGSLNSTSPSIIHADGTKLYYKNSLLHRDGDLPAIEFANGAKEYYKNGKHHRDGDKPAKICKDGSIMYYKNGLRHRDNDLPAFIGVDGTIKFYKDDIEYFPTKFNA